MKAGLEVHQQLAVGKLFCACPAELTEEVTDAFTRSLRAAGGESRSVDIAAAHQAARGLVYRYEAGPSSCLVEMDEEPPHPLNEAALDTALTFALLVGARPMDEIQVMRKIVVDGSNTTGFQRTALVAVDGMLELSGKRYTIPTICLEEDAARKVRESPGEVTYRLDRLGIPLVEVATGPEIVSGPEAREVAEEIGALLRATRRVRRGIGTIREDVNVSTEGGHRVEVKGVQELRLIQEYVEREVARQKLLLELREALVRRRARVPDDPPQEVTDLFREVTSGPFSGAGRGGQVVLAIALPGFSGLLRSPPGTEERLGREFADHARAVGLRGLVHSDELPAYGVSEKLVSELRRRLALGEPDAFVLVTDRSEERATLALKRVAERARAAIQGVPGETRDPLPDGRTRFSRPLPGRDRMYPETDIPPIPITADRLDRLRATLPERPAELEARLAKTHGLPSEVVRQLVYGDLVGRFEALAARGHGAGLVARLLIQDLPAVPARSEGASPFDPSFEVLNTLLTAAEAGTIAKEGVPPVLAALAAGAPTVQAAIEHAGLAGFSREDLNALVRRVVEANAELVQSRGEAAFSPLMGDVMREVRGRRDGREVSEALHAEIARVRASSGA
ncbi:MAG TPA: Glu-tRNA(Gln) amidotransferase subunit GatE [Thermoplasmata archaeon]|nr:Glu-tRNA(Gln) amidotransferase subunit GatE [Thermoplasmata archaeon]